MTLTRRILNLARAELKAAMDKLVGDEDDPDMDAFDKELWEAERQRVVEDEKNRVRTEASPDMSRYYANLELPLGASAAEVRAAYRRLMRRYHPDRHHGDDSKAKVANELAQRLRTAHDKLIEHLEGK